MKLAAEDALSILKVFLLATTALSLLCVGLVASFILIFAGIHIFFLLAFPGPLKVMWIINQWTFFSEVSFCIH